MKSNVNVTHAQQVLENPRMLCPHAMFLHRRNIYFDLELQAEALTYKFPFFNTAIPSSIVPIRLGPVNVSGDAISNAKVDRGQIKGSKKECAAEGLPMADLTVVSV